MHARTAFAIAIVICAFGAYADEAKKDDINNYLVSITGGAVAANNLIGVDKSLVAQIETSQDLVVALQPLTSGDQKAGLGIAITPARTTLLPLSRSAYFSNPLMRLWGGLTISYAQNSEDISGASYKKSAYSLDTMYYFDPDNDPVAVAGKAFETCLAPFKKQNEIDVADTVIKLPPGEARDKKLDELTATLTAKISPCVDKGSTAAQNGAKWNAARISISYGRARIKAPDDTGHSLGKFLTLNGQYPLGNRAVGHLSFRRTRDALDPKSLSTDTPVVKSSSLAAARITYGGQEADTLRALAEVSNVKTSANADYTDAFKYAVGIDKKVANGMWLEFRLGRNRSVESGQEQTTGLLTLSIAPTLMDFKK